MKSWFVVKKPTNDLLPRSKMLNQADARTVWLLSGDNDLRSGVLCEQNSGDVRRVHNSDDAMRINVDQRGEQRLVLLLRLQRHSNDASHSDETIRRGENERVIGHHVMIILVRRRQLVDTRDLQRIVDWQPNAGYNSIVRSDRPGRRDVLRRDARSITGADGSEPPHEPRRLGRRSHNTDYPLPRQEQDVASIAG